MFSERSYLRSDFSRYPGFGLLGIPILLGASLSMAQQAGAPQRAMVGVANSLATAQASEEFEEVVVTAAPRGLIGTATTASEGIVVNDELALTPAYRARRRRGVRSDSNAGLLPIRYRSARGSCLAPWKGSTITAPGTTQMISARSTLPCATATVTSETDIRSPACTITVYGTARRTSLFARSPPG